VLVRVRVDKAKLQLSLVRVASCKGFPFSVFGFQFSVDRTYRTYTTDATHRTYPLPALSAMLALTAFLLLPERCDRINLHGALKWIQVG
jgi:hypothetical protein